MKSAYMIEVEIKLLKKLRCFGLF